MLVGLFLVLQVVCPLVKCFASYSNNLNHDSHVLRHDNPIWNGKDKNVQKNISRRILASSPSAVWTKASDKDDIVNDHGQDHPSIEDTVNENVHHKADTQSNQENAIVTTKEPGIWPCWDELDVRLTKIALPVVANLAINPLIGAVDLFWVNRMGNVLAVAGQAAANQVFNSAFFVVTFLPSVTATLISKENAKNNREGVQDAISQALLLGVMIALVCNVLLFFNPSQVLSSVLMEGAPAMEFATPYLIYRAFAFIPSLISLVGFSAFRGVLDTVTPVKISVFANIINVILDPILIFWASMGVKGAAIATLVAEVVSAIIYLVVLRKRDMLLFWKLLRLPSWKKLEPLLKGGFALQLRNVALNVSLLAVQRVTQRIDSTGVAAAAHQMAIQVFQLGGIVLFALSTVAQTVVPNDMVEKYDDKLKRMTGGIAKAKKTSHRLMSWGLLLGISLGVIQMLALPLIQRSTPLQEVRDAAKIPSILASVFQSMNGLVFIGEGIMVGTGSFLELSLNTIVATAGCLCALNVFPDIYGVTGVWMGLEIFNVLRMIGVYLHLRVYGPLSPRRTRDTSS